MSKFVTIFEAINRTIPQKEIAIALHSLKPELTDNANASDIVKALNKGFPAKYDITFSWKKKNLKTFEIEGEYLIDDKTLHVYLLSKDKNAVVNLKDYWATFVSELSRMIAHEYLHKVQHERSDRKVFNSVGDTEIEYYSDPDEIEAYANTVADSVLLRSKGNKEVAIKSLTDGSYKSPYIDTYVDVFGKDHIVYKKFINKVLKYIEDKTEQK